MPGLAGENVHGDLSLRRRRSCVSDGATRPPDSRVGQDQGPEKVRDASPRPKAALPALHLLAEQARRALAGRTTGRVRRRETHGRRLERCWLQK
jgi:hypothetical protein